MAQERSFEFNTVITSYRYNRIKQGIFTPGLHLGYGSIESVVGPNLSIKLKNNNGLIGIASNGASDVTPWAKLITKQGVVIEINDEPEFNLDSTPGNARVDLIVLNHTYNQVTGGSDATISILTGTPSSTTPPLNGINYGAEPVLPNPNSQIIIGRLYLKQSSSGGTGVRVFNDITYKANYIKETPTLKPLLLDGDRFKTAGFDNQVVVNLDLNSSSIFSSNTLNLTSRANVYRLSGDNEYVINRIQINGALYNGDPTVDAIIPVGTTIRFELATDGTFNNNPFNVTFRLGLSSLSSDAGRTLAPSYGNNITGLFSFMIRPSGFIVLRYNGLNWAVENVNTSVYLQEINKTNGLVEQSGVTLRYTRGNSVVGRLGYPLTVTQSNDAEWQTVSGGNIIHSRFNIKKSSDVTNTNFTNIAAPYKDLTQLFISGSIRFGINIPDVEEGIKLLQIILPSNNPSTGEGWLFPTDVLDCSSFTTTLVVKENVAPGNIYTQMVNVECVPNSTRLIIRPINTDNEEEIFRLMDLALEQVVSWAELRFSSNVVVRNLPY